MNLLADIWLRDTALHLWQATLFGLAIAVVIVLLPGPARLRHFAGCLGLLRFLLPAGVLASLLGFLPWATVAGSWRPAGFGTLWMPAFVVSGNALRTPPAVLNVPLPAILAMVWGVGTLLVFGAGMIRLARGLRAVRRQEIPFSTGDQGRLDTLAARVGLTSGRVTGCFVPPSSWLGVIGIFRSRIVVPEGLFSALDEKEVESVLLHELVHVKRHDNLLRLFQAGVVALFWFHPLVWWLDRRLRWESESACDEAVLRVTGAHRVYASGLFKAVRYALELDLPGVSGMSRTGLQSRIRAVLNHQDRKDSPVKLALTVSTLIGFFCLATLAASTPAAPGGAAASAEQDQVAEGHGVPATSVSADIPTSTPSGGKVLDLSEVDQIPVALKQVPPVYPAELRKAGVMGEVLVGMVVDEQGYVGDVKILHPKELKDGRTADIGGVKVFLDNDQRFEQVAMDAVRQWKFSPGLKGGKPVNVAMSIPIVFTLSEEKPGK
jgi:beta-lactamase regulating signal transducer with metallopeptidase domain